MSLKDSANTPQGSQRPFYLAIIAIVISVLSLVVAVTSRETAREREERKHVEKYMDAENLETRKITESLRNDIEALQRELDGLKTSSQTRPEPSDDR